MTQLFKVSNLTLGGALKMASELFEIEDDNIQLDFGKMYKVRMDGMIYFIKTIKELERQGKHCWPIMDAPYWTSNRPAITYAAHVGFFQALGIDFGKEVGEASSSNTYVPISLITERDLYKLSGTGDLHMGVQSYSEDLAKVLSNDPTLEKVYAYLIREMVRNPFEHSTASHVWVAAQEHKTDGNIEVVISDDGEGIQRTLKINKDFAESLPDDESAVRASLKPGISGKKYARKTGSNWDNSGFGLYVTSRLTSEYGDFLIGSGDFLLAKNDRSELVYMDRPVQIKGTFIRLRLKIDKLNSVDDDIITRIVSEGESEATMLEGAIQTASKASKMLSVPR